MSSARSLFRVVKEGIFSVLSQSLSDRGGVSCEEYGKVSVDVPFKTT